MVESFLYWLAKTISDIVFSPFMWLFTKVSVPMSIIFSLAMLLCVALLFTRWKYGAHKWLGKPIIKVTKIAVPFLFILGVFISGAFKDGDIARTHDQGAYVQLSGEFMITGVLDQSLGGYNISLTPIDVMEDESITDKYAHTKTTHWEPWQVSTGVNISHGEIITVAAVDRDLRLLPELEKRPENLEEGDDEASDLYGALPNKRGSTTP